MNRTICMGTRQTMVSPSIAVVTSYIRSTSQYCIVSAWLWLWLVMILVVTSMFSLAEAIRIPVRFEVKRAEALFSALEWVDWTACAVVSREPCNDELLLPELDELPPPPPIPRKLTPMLELELSVEKALLPFTISLKAELNVAAVDVSESAAWFITSDCEKNSLS